MTVIVLMIGLSPAVAATGPGSELWTTRHDGAAHGPDYASDIAASPDGSMVFVTGSSTGATTGPDYATVAYDSSTGREVWTERYNGPGDSSDYAGSLGVSPDGTVVYVTGIAGADHNADFATVAYEASTGTRLWTTRYDGGDGDYAHALAVSPDGTTVVVIGPSIGSGNEYATVAYDAATGAQLWVRRHHDPVSDNDLPIALDVSPDGSAVFVTGLSEHRSGSRSDYTTFAYDVATGTKLWLQRYNSPFDGSDQPHDLHVSPDGSAVFVTGTSLHPSGWRGDYITVAYDPSTGAELWVDRYDGPSEGSDVAIGVGVSPDGSSVFVTGTSQRSRAGRTDYATIAYEASTGKKLWHRRFSGTRNSNTASAIGISPDGSVVVVTGTSYHQASYNDYATVAYDASTGQRVWLKRYNGRANDSDQPWALALSPNGSAVYVTGSSIGRNVQHDYATLAYRLT
jgi:hypothetical protein